MYLQLAFRNLKRNNIRCSLAIIGIIIGVMAVSSIGIFGASLKMTVLENFQGIADEVFVMPAYSNGYMNISKRTADQISSLPYVQESTPMYLTSTLVGMKNKKAYIKVYGLDIKAVKKIFTPEKGVIRLVGCCVVGHDLAKRYNIRIGDKVSINGKYFRVSAILNETGERFDINANDAVIIYYKDYSKLFNEENYNAMIVWVKNLNDLQPFKNAVNKLINSRKEKVKIFELEMVVKNIKKIFNKMTIFLIAIAAVSLLVAGVSILNIMLMSTLERTKEIGVMMAIGAYRLTILKIFLLEALILGIIGSIIGSLLSVVGGYIVDMLMLHSVKYLFTMSSIYYIVEGLSFGILTALISGLYPAWRASKLEPLEALRYE